MIAAIIGGGFYGAYLALFLREGGLDVRLYERDAELLTGASANNQARIHTGYHYPRDLVTAYRSFVNMPRFMADFKAATFNSFASLYGIAAEGTRISATAFEAMFRKMGAPIEPAAPKFQRLFNPDLVAQVFEVREAVLDTSRLRSILRDRLDRAGVAIFLNTEIARIEPIDGGGYRLRNRDGAELDQVDLVFNCTYSRINHLRTGSGLPVIPINNQIAEIALVEVPPALETIGVTIMDGPFFSILPFPSRDLHTLSHVRYTPHHTWQETGIGTVAGADIIKDNAPIASNYPYMIRDACRYMPLLTECTYKDSLFETKTVLGRNEENDGRPILFQEEVTMPGVYTVIGAKIDNIYDLVDVVSPIRDKYAGIASGTAPQDLQIL